MTQWFNYHYTREVDVADHRRFNADGALEPGPAMTGPQILEASVQLLQAHVRDADALGTRCGLIGKAWSFSWLTGNSPLQLELGGKLGWEIGLADHSGLSGLAGGTLGEIDAASPLDPGKLVWARGGTTMRATALWAEARSLSLPTSGDQLGPSLAGAVATGTHGSRLGYGAVQNMVRGLHLITGPSTSIWLEPASRPVLAERVVRQFADRLVRDDRLFNDALVHLGAMGIVNGLIVELEPKSLFDKDVRVLPLAPVWDAWLEAVTKRDFAMVSKLLGYGGGTPIFYEFSLNPFDLKNEKSVHILYYPSHASIESKESGGTPRPADAVYLYAEQLGAMEMATTTAPQKLDLPALYIQMVEASPLHQEGLPWSLLHDKDQETGARGALFNAGFAIPFAELPKAVDAMCASVASMSADRQFIFTFRFVTSAAGTLAHLRWPETVAIELDGASQLLADQFRVKPNSADGLDLVQRAFSGNGIDFAMHWGKLGNNTTHVKRNFGSAALPRSPIARWRETRHALLPDAVGRRTMQNDLVAGYGLV